MFHLVCFRLRNLFVRHGLAIIAVRLAVQLVEHVCHCDSALAAAFGKCTDNERGVQLIVGENGAATRLLVSLGAESKTGWPI